MLPFYFNTTSVGQFYAMGYTLIWASRDLDYAWTDVIECPVFCCEL